MSMIPEEKIAEIRERASILEIIGDYVSLKRSGANYQGLCPFHGEKTPSFNVNPSREIFHCFGCGLGGNVFTFIMKIEGLSFPEAARFLARRTGVEIDDGPASPAEKRRQDERDLLYRVNELAARYYRQILLEDKEGEAGRQYLNKREVTDAASESYRLGFAPDRWDGLVRYLERQRVPLEAAEKLGLIRRGSGRGYIDLFRNRLLFAISDAQGRVIGFGGRVLDNSLPKYINSPESPIYRKNEVLFGVNLARQAMREVGSAVVVEGYFDHLALFQSDVRNVVATCGTALTPGHAKLLKRYAGKVHTLFDGDEAGAKATLRSMDLFLGEDLPAFVIELPRGEDPDTFIRKEGAAAFSDRVAAARPIFEFFFKSLLKETDAGNVAGKVAVIEKLAPQLAKITNGIERELYIREFSRALGVSERSLQKKVGGKPVTAADFAPPAEPRKSRENRPEEMLLVLMSKYPELAQMVEEHGPERLFSEDLLPVAQALLEQKETGTRADLALILERFAPEERSRLAALFIKDEHIEEIDARKAFEECRISCERRHMNQVDVKALRRELSSLDPESGRYWEILKILDAQRNKKSQLHASA